MYNYYKKVPITPIIISIRLNIVVITIFIHIKNINKHNIYYTYTRVKNVWIENHTFVFCMLLFPYRCICMYDLQFFTPAYV